MGYSLGQDFRGDDERSDGNDFLLQRRRGVAGIPAGGYEDFARPKRALRCGDFPAGFALICLAFKSFDARVLENLRA